MRGVHGPNESRGPLNLCPGRINVATRKCEEMRAFPVFLPVLEEGGCDDSGRSEGSAGSTDYAMDHHTSKLCGNQSILL
jgi:hypothetical protein